MADEERRLLPGDIPKILIANLLFVSPVIIIDPIIAAALGGGVFWVKASEGMGQRLFVRSGMLLPLILAVFILFLFSILAYSRITKISLEGFGFRSPVDLKGALLIGFVGGVGLMLLGDFLEALVLPLFEYFGVTSTHLEISVAFGRAVSNQGLLYIAFVTILVGVLDPIAEEIFFRGVVHTAFQNKDGFKTAVFVSSLVFALAHLDIIILPILFVMGAILAYTYYKTESLLAPVLMHMTNNTVVFLLYMMGIERIFPIFYRLG
ncbi:MAG: lysostaphin resistance A-like protein [Candidatus Hydrothermarchaeales archaeon]